jgi:uncharacterized damage-inducible protein DinB
MTYRVDDPTLLTGMLRGEGVHLDPAAILDGLTPDQAGAKPHELPHSVSEIVAHMCFWQEWFNDCAVRGFNGIPEHAIDGWPSVSGDGWDALRTRYLQAIETAKQIARESDSLASPLLPPDVKIDSLANQSRGSAILQMAAHNSHHLGQIITIRQLMSLWPPPGGTLTW